MFRTTGFLFFLGPILISVERQSMQLLASPVKGLKALRCVLRVDWFQHLHLVRFRSFILTNFDSFANITI